MSKGKDLPGAHRYYSFGKSSAFARKRDWAISMVMRATAVIDLITLYNGVVLRIAPEVKRPCPMVPELL